MTENRIFKMRLEYILSAWFIVSVQYAHARKVGIGDACTSQKMCGDHSDCVEDPSVSFVTTTTCECLAGFVGEVGEKNCLIIPTKVGDQCHLGSSTQCAAINGSECKNDAADTEKGTCRCSAGLVGAHGDPTCQPGVHVGEMCTLDWECMGSQTHCNSHCVCSSNNFVPAWNRQDCLELKTQLGAECSERLQCSSGLLGKDADCLLNPATGKMACKCNNESIASENRTTCLSKATVLGEKCEEQIQCYTAITYSQCKFGECKCVPGTVPSSSGKECLVWVAYGDECTDDTQCVTVENSSCNLVPESLNISVCSCNNNTHIYLEGKCQELATKVGDKCDLHPEQCTNISNSTCQDGFCLCENDTHVSSQDNSGCLPKVNTINGLCEESVQCTINGSACEKETESRKTCQCLQIFYQEILGQCLPLYVFPPQLQLNGPCTLSVQCQKGVGEHSECSKDGFCKCANGSMQLNGKCFIPAPLHHNCSNDEACRLGSNHLAVCKTTSAVSTCKCNKNAAEVENKCWEKLTLGEDCEADEECQLGIKGPSACDPRNRKCDCLNPYVDGPTKNTCVIPGASRGSTLCNILELVATCSGFVTYFSLKW